MPGNLTDYSEKAMNDWLMTGQTVTRPAAWYVGLCSTTTDDTQTGGMEITGTGYARQSITFGATSSPGGQTSNTSAVTFTAGAAWGTAVDLIICDAATGGNRLWHGPLNASRNFQANGDSLTIPVGALTLTLD
jgi:hypothetical protein